MVRFCYEWTCWIKILCPKIVRNYMIMYLYSTITGGRNHNVNYKTLFHSDYGTEDG